jgi:hypothetical protein
MLKIHLFNFSSLLQFLDNNILETLARFSKITSKKQQNVTSFSMIVEVTEVNTNTQRISGLLLLFFRLLLPYILFTFYQKIYILSTLRFILQTQKQA